MKASAICALATVLAAPAFGQETDRYTLERTGDGFVRMDRSTGEMSVCALRDTQLVCKLAADERTAFESQVDGLTERVEKLERRLAEIEKRPAADLPSESEFEQTMSMMERFLRRFWGIVKEFESEQEKPADEPSTPQRT